MADKKKPGIALGGDAFITDREPVLIPSGDGFVTLYARRLGYLELQALIGRCKALGVSLLIPLVVASIEDDDGNRFTDAEAGALRKEVAEPLFEAAMKVNKLGEEGSGN